MASFRIAKFRAAVVGATAIIALTGCGGALARGGGHGGHGHVGHGHFGHDQYAQGDNCHYVKNASRVVKVCSEDSD